MIEYPKDKEEAIKRAIVYLKNVIAFEDLSYGSVKSISDVIRIIEALKEVREFNKDKKGMKTFEEYLSEQFGKQYTGLDDDSPEAEQDWLAELEPRDFIDYGQNWIKERYNEKT